MKTVEFQCDCIDKGCPTHKGEHCHFQARVNLHRDDMCTIGYGDGSTLKCLCIPLEFCDACADDALESGVFSVVEP